MSGRRSCRDVEAQRASKGRLPRAPNGRDRPPQLPAQAAASSQQVQSDQPSRSQLRQFQNKNGGGQARGSCRVFAYVRFAVTG